MKFFVSVIIFIALSCVVKGQHKFVVDLSQASAKQLMVEAYPAKTSDKYLTFHLQKIQTANFNNNDGTNAINSFVALTADGKRLPVRFGDNNDIIISKANELHKIEYAINISNSKSGEYQPGALIIVPNQFYLLNFNRILGYFNNNINHAYEVKIKKNAGLSGSSGIKINSVSASEDQIVTKSFMELIDNPVMYANADTIGFTVGKCKFNIACFSQSGNIDANKLYNFLLPLTVAVNDFLGEIPVTSYQFMFYFTNEESAESKKHAGHGALMHSNSSFYVLPEKSNYDALMKMVQKSAAHELLHMFIPGELYSKNMAVNSIETNGITKHLWLYEGATEYFSLLMLYRYQFISDKNFLDALRSKILVAQKFQKTSLTKLSENVSKAKYKDQFQNIYYKGALASMMLDLQINETTKGKQNLLSVLQTIANNHKGNGFDDDQLFSEIAYLTNESVTRSINENLNGKHDIDYNKYLSSIGIKYQKLKVEKKYSFGDLKHKLNEQGQIVVSNKFYNKFQLKTGDVIKAVNGDAVNRENFRKLMPLVLFPKVDDEIIVTYERGGKTAKVKAKPSQTTDRRKHHLEFNRAYFDKYKSNFENWLKLQDYPS